MATYPWRIQADLKEGDTDPDVTVFVGDTITNDTTGEQTLHQNTADPIIVPLSELYTYITTAMTSGIIRDDGDARKPAAPPPPKPGRKA